MTNQRQFRVRLFCLICLVALGVGLVSYASKSAAQIGSAAAIWSDLNPANLLRGGTRIIRPRRYRTLPLDPVAIRGLLSKAPMEFSRAAKNGGRVEISLPKP